MKTITSSHHRGLLGVVVLYTCHVVGAAPARGNDAPAAGLPPQISEEQRITDPLLVAPPKSTKVLASWQDALDILRRRSFRIRNAEAELEQAEGVAKQIRAALLPSLAATGGITQHLLLGTGTGFLPGGIQQGTIPDPALTWNGSINLTIPIFSPKAWFDTATAARSEESAAVALRDSKRLALAVLSESVTAVLTAERLAEVSRISLESAMAVAALTKRVSRMGSASRLDVARAEEEVLLAKTAVVKANDAFARTQEVLGVALGDSEQWGVGPDLTLDSVLTAIGHACAIQSSVDARDDVRAARLRMTVAERNLRSADYFFLPTVAGVSSLTYYSTVLAAPNAMHVAWTVGGFLYWPLVDGGFHGGQKLTNRGVYDAARLALEVKVRNAQVEISEAKRTAHVAAETVELSRARRDAAAETARLSRLTFAGGESTALELVDATRRWHEAEIDMVVKTFALAQARLADIFATAQCEM